MAIRFTKSEQRVRKEAHKYLREYKAKCKKRDIQVTASSRHGRQIIASGYDNVSDAKSYLSKLKKNPKSLKALGYSNPRIKIVKRVR